MSLNPESVPEETKADSPEKLDRRDLVQKFGKLGAYAAPFTLLAATTYAAKGTGSGKHATGGQ